MFDESERKIFMCPLGGQMVYADPVAVIRNLKIHTGGRFNKLVDEANVLQTRPDDPQYQPPPEESPEHVQALIARGVLAGATVAAFNLQPFDPFSGAGTLEEDALALLTQFMLWHAAKKKSGGTPPS